MIFNMGYKINYQGIEITASTVGEAVALAQQLAAANGAAPRLGRPPRSESIDLFEGSGKDEATSFALGFLTALSRAGANGVPSDEMVRVLSVEHPKGIGGRLVRINNALRKRKLSPEDVYSSRDVDEVRTWFASSALEEAIQALKK